jgi:hypothetical protein
VLGGCRQVPVALFRNFTTGEETEVALWSLSQVNVEVTPLRVLEICAPLAS